MRRFGFFKKTGILFLVLTLFFSAFVFPSFAESENNVFSELTNSTGKLLAVSKYGNTREFPEQSLEAIASASEQGADMIYIRLRKTSDDYIVLMSDENLSRMCVDSLGNTVTKNVSEIGYHELSTYHLRKSTGGLHEEITNSTVPTIQEVIEQTKGSTVLLIDGAWEFRDEIYDLLRDNNVLSSVVLLNNGDNKSTAQWLSSKAPMPLVMSKYQGNIVFKATSTIKKTLNEGAVGTLLMTSNAYGMNFKSVVMDNFGDKGRAAIDMTDPKLCGSRKDNPEGWNDVTARGYSIIITNDIPEILEFFQRVYTQKERLGVLIKQAQNVDVTLCSTSTSNALKDAIISAKEIYETSNSEQQLLEIKYQLVSAMNLLSDRTENEGKTVTKGRIITVVLVVVALILFEIILARQNTGTVLNES